MANNFFLNQDPLLFQSPYAQRLTDNEIDQKQLTDALLQYKMLQQGQQNASVRDYFGELDKLVRTIDESSIEALNTNKEYIGLKGDLMDLVQSEIMANIKWKINANPKAIKNMERQLEIINTAKKDSDDEQRKNISEINDYVKNYSNMTFDEYKKMKKNRNTNEKDRIQKEDKRQTK